MLDHESREQLREHLDDVADATIDEFVRAGNVVRFGRILIERLGPSSLCDVVDACREWWTSNLPEDDHTGLLASAHTKLFAPIEDALEAVAADPR